MNSVTVSLLTHLYNKSLVQSTVFDDSTDEILFESEFSSYRNAFDAAYKWLESSGEDWIVNVVDRTSI